MYNYTNKVYTLHVPGDTLIENTYKNYALADDKVFNGNKMQSYVTCLRFIRKHSPSWVQ